MKRILGALLSFGMVVAVCGQTVPVTPSTPKAFKKRDLGGSLGTAAVGVRRAQPVKEPIRQLIAVSEVREFVSVDGKAIKAQLIAFEEGDAAKAKLPLTLIKDAKIRILVTGKTQPSVVALSRLREEDQDFVRAVERANQTKTAAAKADPKDS